MENKKIVGVIAAIIIALFGLNAASSITEEFVNFRPEISTSLTKVLVGDGGGVTPPDDQTLCDGSGWIIHGDGHKTPCPGCAACAGSKYQPRWDIEGNMEWAKDRDKLIGHLNATHRYTKVSLEKLSLEELQKLHDTDHDEEKANGTRPTILRPLRSRILNFFRLRR